MRLTVVCTLMLIALAVGALDLSAPMDEYVVSSGVGVRADPMGGGRDQFHRGLDLVGPPGAVVRAAAAGTVIRVWPPPDGYYRGHPVYGGMILISHGELTYTLYGHLSAVLVWEGWHVWQDRVIGIQGNTGISTGEHLHFEIIIEPEIPPPKPKPDPMDEYMRRAARYFQARAQEERNVAP